MEERSPLNDAIDCGIYQPRPRPCHLGVLTFRKELQEPLFCGDTPPASSLDGPAVVVFREGDMIDHCKRSRYLRENREEVARERG